MAPSKSTASPTPGPATSAVKNHQAMATELYNWCRQNYDEDHIFSQKDLLEGDIISNRNPDLLRPIVQALIDQRLFRTHELRGGGLGWKIVSHGSAEK
jgi:RNA polymerase Rpc34 subunit